MAVLTAAPAIPYTPAMPDLDLPPDDYRVRDPKSGRWFQRDVRWTLYVGLAIDVVILGVTWWYRDELSSGVLFGLTAIIGASAGLLLGRLLKDVY